MNNWENIIKSIEAGRLLDVASGRGNSIKFALENFSNVIECVGIDVSEANIESAKQAVQDERVRFMLMNGASMSFNDNEFDTVTMFNSMHHLKNTDQVMSEIFRVLKPGGKFILSEMYRDVKTDKEKNHVDLHHWWAEIDMKNGIPHFLTFRRRDILHTALTRPYSCINCYEPDENRNANKDAVEHICSVIDTYFDKAANLPDKDRIIMQGEKIRQRILDIGLTFAPYLIIIASK